MWIQDLIDAYVPRILRWLAEEGQLMSRMEDIAMVASLLRMLETFIAAPEGK